MRFSENGTIKHYKVPDLHSNVNNFEKYLPKQGQKMDWNLMHGMAL